MRLVSRVGIDATIDIGRGGSCGDAFAIPLAHVVVGRRSHWRLTPIGGATGPVSGWRDSCSCDATCVVRSNAFPAVR